MHYEERHNFYTSLNIIRVFKMRRMRWENYVALMGELRNKYKSIQNFGWQP
jgi:hypothetical protein